jgi:hypothetical protein
VLSARLAVTPAHAASAGLLPPGYLSHISSTTWSPVCHWSHWVLPVHCILDSTHPAPFFEANPMSCPNGPE